MIDAANRDKDSAAMVRAILSIARELSIEVVAAGVESAAHWSFLTTSAPVSKVQGYYYSKPVPVEDATSLLKHKRIAPHAAAGPAGGARSNTH